jgi:hypothetical protein
MKRRIWLAWVALVCAAACGNANVAGNYTAAVINRGDGCSIGWTVGMASTTPFTVTQSGGDITVMVTGLAQFFFSGLLGTNTLTGEVDGDDVDAGVTGTMRQSSGNCEFTFNARIIATQGGDSMNGRVEYRAATNDHPDCGSRKGCVSTQEFNATRPPPSE